VPHAVQLNLTLLLFHMCEEQRSVSGRFFALFLKQFLKKSVTPDKNLFQHVEETPVIAGFFWRSDGKNNGPGQCRYG
jgi:hypothetical protein